MEGCDAALVEFERGVKRRKWTLEVGTTHTIGREGCGADVELPHSTLSRLHCTVKLDNDPHGVMVTFADQGSTNGTFVNGRRLSKDSPVVLRPEAVRHVRFGECDNGYRVLVKGGTDGRGPSGATSDKHVVCIDDETCAQQKESESSQQAVVCVDDETGTVEKERIRAQESSRRERRKAAEVKRKVEEIKQWESEQAKRHRRGTEERSGLKLTGLDRLMRKVVRGLERAPDAPADVEAGSIEWPEDWR